MKEADIKGVEGVINMLKISNAKNIAIYDVFKQNKLPLFKADASNTDELIKKFENFATSLQNKNYDIVITDGEEKIKFTFSNNTATNDNLADVISNIIESKLSSINTPKKELSEITEVIEYKVENKFLKQEVERLKNEIKELEEYISELEAENELLSDKVKKEDDFLKFYNLLSKKQPTTTSQPPALADNQKEQLIAEKKELIKKIAELLNKNFNNTELKKLYQFLEGNINTIKSQLL